ncbi:hypothetical protein BOX15_Mlig000832g1 [Macrostomum lignano]|uniref:Uncharacterized protein n=1 Tax=Macrostomum lignano TaxID=282301 RepID=A0A267GK61_9PLAT|nr:hypothetical protein BOX15_Mlig000832g1 [Macrostomum lignano]
MKITLLQAGRTVQEEIVYCVPDQSQQQQPAQQQSLQTQQQHHGTISRSMRNAFITISYGTSGGSGGGSGRPSSAASQPSNGGSDLQPQDWRRGSQESLQWRQPIAAILAGSVSDDSSGRQPIGSESTDDSSPGQVMFRSMQAEPPDLLPSEAGQFSLMQQQQQQPSTAGAVHSNSIVVRPTPCRPAASTSELAAPTAVTSARRHSTASAASVVGRAAPNGHAVVACGSDSGLSQEEPSAVCGYSSDCCCATSSFPSGAGVIKGGEKFVQLRQLRERESELAMLRRTMEQNEAALMRVFEERRTELENRLRAELSLNSRLAPGLSQANRRVRQCEQVIADLRLQAQLQSGELRAGRSRNRRLEAELAAQTERASGLEAALAASNESLEAATREVHRLRQQLPTAPAAERACQTEDSASVESTTAATAAAEAEVEAAQSKLEETRKLLLLAEERSREQEASFQMERSQWLEEKSKVIGYQRQLQANQKQLVATCRHLEGEVARLTELLESGMSPQLQGK